MRTRRSTRSSDVSANGHGVLDNLQTEDSVRQTSYVVEQPATLANASKQDVDKLLDRAGIRGAIAKEQSKRVRDELHFDSRKRGKQKASVERESSLFYQRKVSNQRSADQQYDQSENSLVCGALASTVSDVRYGVSSGREDLLSIIKDPLPSEMDHILGERVCNPAENLDKLLESKQPLSTDLEIKSKDVSKEVHAVDDGFDWEVGCEIYGGAVEEEAQEGKVGSAEIKVEIDTGTPTISEKQGGKRVIRRATAKDKEFAELVHKAHLLCLIARGRMVDNACNDPLLQASLLSMVPSQINFSDTEKTSALELAPLVKWFQATFQIRSEGALASSSAPTSAQEDFVTCLFSALRKQTGTSEEVAALSVALLRGIGFTTRYAAALDVVSIKPDTISLEASLDWDPDGNAAADDVADILSKPYLNRNNAFSLGQYLAKCAPQPFAVDTAAKLQPTDLTINASSSPTYEREKGRFGRIRGQARNKENERLQDFSSPSFIQSGKSKVSKIESSYTRSTSQTCNNEANNKSPDIISDVSAVQKGEECSKRKGDLEFEMHLAMAIAATAADQNIGPDTPEMNTLCTDQEQKDVTFSNQPLPINNSTRVTGQMTRRHGKDITNSSTTTSAMWSRKMGPLLYWAEVYCGGGDSGRWVHVDAGRGILDKAGMVEGAAASCKFPIRYVLAFAGSGVKDVTRRYVTSWSAIGPLRVDSSWWSVTLAPLKALEAIATSGRSLGMNAQNSATKMVLNASDPVQEHPTILENLAKGTKDANTSGDKSIGGSSSKYLQQAYDRGSLEDMELDVRAYTEPLPTNQQAFKNHPLYVLERWLTKYQTLYPRGPILGYCGGQPVFPRTCVQNLHTAERWLREGLKVKVDETPAKTVNNHRLVSRHGLDDSIAAVDEVSGEQPTIALFGKWQTEPWHPPKATGGMVPKNDRGNVEVWSEKCLPLGTVHIRLPRILPIAKKLEIDFAPAMVGFEIRSRRSVPVFEGIVVCQEFEAILLEGYAEEEQRRQVEVEEKRQSQAIARWSQLLQSIATRQRLQATYEVSQVDTCNVLPNPGDENCCTLSINKLPSLDNQHCNYLEDIGGNWLSASNPELPKHEHTFPEENQSFDDGKGIWTKTCPCGFTLTVEEM